MYEKNTSSKSAKFSFQILYNTVFYLQKRQYFVTIFFQEKKIKIKDTEYLNHAFSSQWSYVNRKIAIAIILAINHIK